MLKDHIWEAFELAEANERTVDIGVDMLACNLDNPPGAYFFGGADRLDYPALREVWSHLNEDARAEARTEAKALIRAHYDELCAAFAARDRERFEAILHAE